MTSLQKLWNYNNWANERLFKTFDHFRETIPTSSIRLLSHIVNTQKSWLTRLLGEHSNVEAWAIHNLEECKQIHTETSVGYKKLLENPADDLERIIHYKNSLGQSFHNTVHDIILQVMTMAVTTAARLLWICDSAVWSQRIPIISCSCDKFYCRGFLLVKPVG